jgi:two-component sensor histidine kinase
MRYFLFFFFFVNLNFSQTYNQLIEYNSSNGLPSDIIYNVVQDKKGYIWIATDNGIVKFNGSTFKKFQLGEGLPSNDIFGLAVDSKNKIWITGYYNGLYYIENDKVKKVKNSENINCLEFTFEYDGKEYFKPFNGYESYVVEYNTLKKIYFEKKYEILNQDKNYLLLVEKNTKIHFIFNKLTKQKIKVPYDYIFYRNFGKKNELNFILKSFVPLLVNKNFSTKIITYDRQKTIPKHTNNFKKIQWLNGSNDNINRIYLYNNDSVFVTKNDIYNRVNSEKIKKIPVDLESVYTILIDNEDNFWVILKNNRLLFLPNNFDQIESYFTDSIFDKKNIQIKHSLIHRKDLYILSNENNLYSFNTNSRKLTCLKKIKDKNPYQIKIINNKIILFCYEGFYYFELLPNKTIKELSFKPTKFQKNGAVYKDKLYYIFLNDIYDEKNRIINTYQSVMRLNSIIALDSNTLVTGNEEEIILLKNGKEIINNKIKLTNVINKIDNKILIGTNSKGLYIINKQLQIEQILLDKENIYKLLVDEKKQIVFAVTDEGILVYKKLNNTFVLNNKITYKNGLIRGKINGLYFENNKLYASTRNGFSIINDPLFITKKEQGKIDIEKITCNDKTIHFNNSTPLHFKSNENNIDIITSIFSFDSKENQTKYYSISKDNSEDVWKKFKHSTLSFKELASGNYRISFYVNNKKDIQSVSFSIEPKFTDSLTFKIIISALSVAFLIILFYSYSWYTKRQFKQKLILHTLELKSLRSQMSPHFIFNALNNFQSILILEGNIKANNYLDKFSKLIRKTLETMHHDKHSLKSEFEYIEKYLDFEKTKNNDLQTSINIDPDIELSKILIPVMIIQPIIENAIIHGLSKIVGVKKINIDFTKDSNNNIKIIIEDNGIGINHSLKTSNHKSIASNIINERIKLHNKIRQNKIHIEKIDLQNENATGTRVTIQIEQKVKHR